MSKISGTFDVTLAPQPPSDSAATAGLDRRSLTKRFHGPLDASSHGEMLSAMGSVQGSAGYVAMEKVEGTLDGLAGSFILQHSGTMTRGAPALSVSVVPDTGTGALAGLRGTMAIRIEQGKHFYDFDYQLDGG